MKLTEADKRDFEKKLKLFQKGRQSMDDKEAALRKYYKIPAEPKESTELEIPKEAYELGQPEGIYVKVFEFKADGSVGKLARYVKIKELKNDKAEAPEQPGSDSNETAPA